VPQSAPDPLRAILWGHILNHMVQYASTHLDSAFAALSDATRRGVLEQLGTADASITELADRFDMTRTGMKKHVGVLEAAGLVRTQKVGRVRTCRLGPQRLADVNAWLERYRRMWEERFAELDRVLEELQQQGKSDDQRTER
jgi:DNA-binding transcriptional ArsR family regulator